MLRVGAQPGELMKPNNYTVTDGKLVLNLERAKEGGYIVTTPFEPQLVTEADTIEEAFEMARDALKALAQSRAKLLRRTRLINTG
jgi:predicted RNase H-like HicB family nuclease